MPLRPLKNLFSLPLAFVFKYIVKWCRLTVISKKSKISKMLIDGSAVVDLGTTLPIIIDRRLYKKNSTNSTSFREEQEIGRSLRDKSCQRLQRTFQRGANRIAGLNTKWLNGLNNVYRARSCRNILMVHPPLFSPIWFHYAIHCSRQLVKFARSMPEHSCRTSVTY